MKKYLYLILISFLLITGCGSVKKIKQIVNKEVKSKSETTTNETKVIIPSGYEFKNISNIKNFKSLNVPVSGYGKIPISNNGGKDKNKPVFGKGFKLKQNNGDEKMPWIDYDGNQVLIMSDRFKGNLDSQLELFNDVYSVVPKALKKYAEEKIEKEIINGYESIKININYYRKPQNKDARRLTYGYIVQYSPTDAAFFIVMGVRTKESELANHIKRIDPALRYMIKTAEFIN